MSNIDQTESQTDRILNWLQSGKPLTRLDAVKMDMGIELPTRIYEIIHEKNIPVKKRDKEIITASGRKTTVKEYYL